MKTKDNDVGGFAGVGHRTAGVSCTPLSNEGVGEHVRIRFHLGKSAGEIADLKIRTERRNLFLLPDRFSIKALAPRKIDPAV